MVYDWLCMSFVGRFCVRRTLGWMTHSVEKKQEAKKLEPFGRRFKMFSRHEEIAESSFLPATIIVELMPLSLFVFCYIFFIWPFPSCLLRRFCWCFQKWHLLVVQSYCCFNMGQSRPLCVYFCPFHTSFLIALEKIVHDLLGIRT